MTYRLLHSEPDDNPQVVVVLEEALERARRGEVCSVALAYLAQGEDCIALAVEPGHTNAMMGALDTLHTRVSEGDEWL